MQVNVVPDKFVLGVDIRVTPSTPIKQFEATLRGWLADWVVQVAG